MKLRSVETRTSNTQVFTPSILADFMAKLLIRGSRIELLDPGSGPGALTEAVVARCQSVNVEVSGVTLVEEDPYLALDASVALQDLSAPHREVICSDFVEWALEELSRGRTFTHIVLNPPYAKLHARSAMASSLRAHGVSAPNLYAAFLWLSLALLSENGILVAVVPRSFLTGSTFTKMRHYFAQRTKITAIHHFKSRSAVFARDGILQEVVVVRFERSPEVEEVFVSASNGLDDLASVAPFAVPLTRIQNPDSPDLAILIPSKQASLIPEHAPLILAGFRVQTGSVVDFRSAAAITNTAITGTVPLIGSECFSDRSSAELHPEDAHRHLTLAETTANHVKRQGVYLATRRISPRERQPRLDVRLVDTANFPDGVAFENHVNVIGSLSQDLDRTKAIELMTILTQALTDQQLDERLSSTQVNAADLRQLRYVPNND